MRLIGDIHGNWSLYHRAKRGASTSLQLGDLGVGFPGIPYPKRWSATHRFIRGNHDNPSVCRGHPNYAADWGYLPELCLFFIGGAESVDRNRRVPGRDWWADEQISYCDLQKMIDVCIQSQPVVIVSHTTPACVTARVTVLPYRESRTDAALQVILEECHPKLWVFGHHHQSRNFAFGGTHFIGLTEAETFDLSPEAFA